MSTHVRITGSSSSGRCHYCACQTFPPGSPEALREPDVMRTIDHYMPRLLGAGNTFAGERNTVIACRACNTIKAGWPPDVFNWFIRQPQFKGTAKQRAAEFHKFCHALVLAGFKASRALALASRPKPKVEPLRGPQGRFTKRDLRRSA